MFDVIGFWAVATILSVYPIYVFARVVSRGILSRLKSHMEWLTWSDFPGYSNEAFQAQPYPHSYQKFHDALFKYEWVRWFQGADMVVAGAIVFVNCVFSVERNLIGTTYIERISMFSENVSTVSGWVVAILGGWLVFDKGLAIFAKFSALIQKGEK